MRVYHEKGKYKLIHGEAVEGLRSLPDNSIGSMVTDPPAGVGLNGKLGDGFEPGYVDQAQHKEFTRLTGKKQRFAPAYYSGICDRSRKGAALFRMQLQEIFVECHRVLKPGAFALVWASTRSFHWAAAALENAGFEIFDVVIHISGSGVPMWGNLKPVADLWIMARKAPEGTLAENVRQWGTGALNIDGCRVGLRYPGNLMLSHHEECGRDCVPSCPIGDLRERRVAHYYYQNRTDRPRNAHPTVKPTRLMRYLCRLVTPRGEVVLDPFCGSGSTGVAALMEGCRFVGIEREVLYIETARKRIEWAIAVMDHAGKP